MAVMDEGEETRLIISKELKNSSAVLVIHLLKVLIKHSKYRQVIASRKHLRAYLNIYYDAVIACIRDAESILIFGPGEAKGELKKRLERDNLDGCIVGIETVDKMSDHQIAIKVRQYFLKEEQ